MSLREDNHRFQIPELTSHQVTNVSKALQYLGNGNKTRSTANTAKNESSSRSHALFRINLRRVVSGVGYEDEKTREAVVSYLIIM